MNNIVEFVRESNRIEGILREPTWQEISAFQKFLSLEKIDIAELCAFVSVYQPDAVLRDQVGLNVRVGNHIPIPGGPEVVHSLAGLLFANEFDKISAFELHALYETLHPFTDGNGRSGRALWAWKMKEFPLGFLHHWYYQSLENFGK